MSFKVSPVISTDAGDFIGPVMEFSNERAAMEAVAAGNLNTSINGVKIAYSSFQIVDNDNR